MNYPSITGYEITGVLGEGGMGTVYLAKQLSLTRSVAIKILPETLARNESYVRRFHQEALAAAKLKHSGIVQIYDAGEDKGQYYFVMEYVNGETAGNRLRRKGRINEENALLIAEAVGVALEYAWEQAKIVHRDVKPDNILIDEDGTVKISDLGLAKMVDKSSTAITMVKSLVGTPHYCAPEQAKGKSDVDFRVDVYALGATLYHFVTGNAPFGDSSGISAMVRNVTDYLKDPMEISKDISENFCWLVEKMMAKERNKRQTTWQGVLDDIDRVMNKKPPLSPPLTEGDSTIMRSAVRSRSPRINPLQRLFSRRPHAYSTDGGEGKKKASPLFRVFVSVMTAVTLALCTLWLLKERPDLVDRIRNMDLIPSRSDSMPADSPESPGDK